MVPLECVSKAIDYFYTGKWREDAGKLVMQRYMVTFKGLITGVGYVNLRDVVPIGIYGKYYAFFGIETSRHIVEEFIKKFSDRKDYETVITYRYGFVFIFPEGKLYIDMTNIPIEYRITILDLMTTLIGVIIYYKLPTHESIYFMFPSRNVIEGKVPLNLCIGEELTYEDVIRASAGLVGNIYASLIYSKCIYCVLSRNPPLTINAETLSIDELKKLHETDKEITKKCIEKITKTLTIILK